MEPLVFVHAAAGVGLLLVALLSGVWGLARTRPITSGERDGEGRWFAQALQLTHTLVALTGLLGIALLVAGHGARDPLHARVYGPFMVVAILAAYGYRTRDAARNVRVFAVASLVILALGLRATVTG